MIPENEFKTKLIESLGFKNGWIDGDLEKSHGKKADVINKRLRVAIEIKDDTVHKTVEPTPENPMVTSTTDLTIMNSILTDHMRDARKKFKNYPGYKTILLIRTEHRIMESVRYSIEGLHSYTQTNYAGRKSKYSIHVRENIGCFVIHNKYCDYFYIPNPFCKFKDNKVSNTEAENILQIKIPEII